LCRKIARSDYSLRALLFRGRESAKREEVRAKTDDRGESAFGGKPECKEESGKREAKEKAEGRVEAAWPRPTRPVKPRGPLACTGFSAVT
jgi:hypothetical protein